MAAFDGFRMTEATSVISAERKEQLSDYEFVSGLYYLMLGRFAFEQEIEAYLEKMKRGLKRFDAVRLVVQSDEFRQRIQQDQSAVVAGHDWTAPETINCVARKTIDVSSALIANRIPTVSLQSIVSEVGSASPSVVPEAKIAARSTVATARTRSRKGAKWIVLSHCQALGLANCLAQQNPGTEVSACDVWTFKHNPDYWWPLIKECDHLFLNSDLRSSKDFDFSSIENITYVPALWFGGYHPDICYLSSNRARVRTVLGDYNSLIALASYLKGLPVDEAVKRFNGKTYEAAGYFDVWTADRDLVLPIWKNIGYDLTPAFRRWSMRGSFMHSINHPHIQCLYDVARIASQKAGFEPVIGNEDFHPHDNLKYGPIYPVYPEIGEAHGVPGSYWFKAPDRYGLISLEDFVADSYAAYKQYDRTTLVVDNFFKRRFALVFKAI